MIPSVEKTIHYLDCISKQNYTVKFADCVYQITAKSEFYVRPTMFLKDNCLSCGQCCRNYDTVMFPNDMPKITKLAENGSLAHKEYLDKAEKLSIFVDDTEKFYFSVPPMTAKDSHDIWCTKHNVLNCRWIFMLDDKKLCKIHDYRCITCGFPHMTLYVNGKNDIGFLGHKQFMRNHQLGCPVDIKKEPADKRTLDDNIYWLTRLNSVADYLGISTYLPEVIDYLKCIDIDNPPDDSLVLKRGHTKKIFNLD